MLLRKPHTKTALIFNALRRQYMPSSITCVALPKRHIMPAKALDRPLPLDNARAYAMCGLPACRSSPAPWRGVFVGFHALSVPPVSEQGRLAKKDAGGCLSARWSMKRCQWYSQWCLALVIIVALPFSMACTVITPYSHSSARPSACQKSGSRKVSATGIMKEDALSFRVHTEYSLLAPP